MRASDRYPAQPILDACVAVLKRKLPSAAERARFNAILRGVEEAKPAPAKPLLNVPGKDGYVSDETLEGAVQRDMQQVARLAGIAKCDIARALAAFTAFLRAQPTHKRLVYSVSSVAGAWFAG